MSPLSISKNVICPPPPAIGPNIESPNPVIKLSALYALGLKYIIVGGRFGFVTFEPAPTAKNLPLLGATNAFVFSKL